MGIAEAVAMRDLDRNLDRSSAQRPEIARKVV
jgi:hypothetical protein